MKPIYIVLLGGLALAAYIFATGLRDIQRYRDMRAMQRMHELAIASYLLESVAEHARQIGARRVLAINLVVGERSGVVDESLRFSFDLLAAGTLAENAQINARRVPMRFGCTGCDAEYQPSGDDFACPRCGAVGQVVDDGSQLVIESIEIEDED